MRGVTLRVILAAVPLLLGATCLRAAVLDEFRVFIEFNDTDQDVGLHIFLDAEDWQVMKIIDPRGRVIFHVQGVHGLGSIGLSELFVEGSEPSLADLPLDEFFELFPEGVYTFVGKTTDGAKIKNLYTFSHDIPDAPVIVSPAPGGLVDPANAVISWQPVTTPQGIVIDGYEVIVGSLSRKVPATTTSVTLPPGFLQPGTEYGFEVLSIADNHNQTITASSFRTP